MSMLQKFLAEVNQIVDKVLDDLVPKAEVEPKRLHEAIRWSLFAGGKRIRPAILFAAGRTFGAETAQLSCSAAAIEMIHTYSLIHDDLPAMDDDDLRRGKATCHKQFGEATAILVGDALQALAYKAIANDERLSAEVRVTIISLLAKATGTPAGMVSGQQLDLDAEGQTLSIVEIEQIHSQKTGAVFTAAAKAGAIIGGAGDHEIVAIGNYASRLGLLFQITDDLLDATQETETLGKTAGKDAMVDKATFPGHLGIDETRRMAESIRDETCLSLDAIDKNTRLLSDLVGFVIERKR